MRSLTCSVAAVVAIVATTAVLTTAPLDAELVQDSDESTELTVDERSLIPERAPVFTYRDGRMALLVQELERTSPTAARMLRTLRAFGTSVVFGTIDGVLEDVRTEHHHYDPVRQRALGFMAPLVTQGVGHGPALASTIVIGLNLGRLDELFVTARGIPRPVDVSWTEIQRLETLALLGHEIVHAHGLVMANGDPRYGCRDPMGDETPELSCVVVAENVIRQEIGAPLDWGYGMSPLADLPGRYARLSRHRHAMRSIGEVARTVLHGPSATSPSEP